MTVRIYFVYWKDPSQARVLQTVHDIAQNDDLKILPALDGKSIVNCAFLSQETVLKHKGTSFTYTHSHIRIAFSYLVKGAELSFLV
jgi:hypothetical protein